MDGQPMLQSTATSTNNTIEEVSVGCIMHRYKGYKAKRRWGQLRIEAKNKTARCVIRLYKYDVLNIHQEINKSKEPKLKYELEFNNEDFCGMEKGEHYDKHGQRRYLCIITKDKHLIIEDAVVTATGINHNVLAKWYDLLTQVMKYANRWKLIENNPKLAIKICYLHVSMENIAECHSLEDRTRENRNCLVLRMWKTRSLTDIKERETTMEGGRTFTNISFNVNDNSGVVDTVNMTVEGTPNLRLIIQKLKRSNGELNSAIATRTVCPGFDDLNFHPNLTKLPSGKGLKKYLPKTLSSSNSKDDVSNAQQVTKASRSSLGNLYVKLDQDEQKQMPPPYYHQDEQKQMPPPYYNVTTPPERKDNPSTSNHTDSLDRKNAPCLHDSNPRIKMPPSLLDQAAARKSDTGHLMPLLRRDSSQNGRHSSISPPRLPSPGFGDEDSKKAPALLTQTSLDAGYQTGDHSLFTETSLSQNHYVNAFQGTGEPEFQRNETPTRSRVLAENSVYQNMLPEQPPALPARDELVPAPQGPYMNLLDGLNSAPPVPPQISKAPPLPPKDNNSQIVPSSNSYPVKLKESKENHAPPLPGRSPSVDEEAPRPREDLITLSIREGTLPSRSTAEQLPSYENSDGGIVFEISINEVLRGLHLGETRWLDLPHSVFVKIAIGLEKEGITVGNWKALAERLGLTFQNIQHLSTLMRVHSGLRPLTVLLWHWSKTESPCPFTKDNLRELLESIDRDDLAQMIP